ncbi:MAG: universal stress protein [Alphaproteobacteria bacterium]|nr:universal stress protein [Alphaproteobacteria bacterium]NNF23503.1 universal stress protein [Paracoccaceae bacterium]
MYKKIIVSLALDHGIGEQALQTARQLRADDGKIFAVHVYEPLHGSVATYVDDEAVTAAVDGAKSRLNDRVAGMADVEPVLLKGHTGQALVDYAHKIDADCIIMGSHKPGLRDFLLGSTAARVVRHAPCSVHVLR